MLTSIFHLAISISDIWFPSLISNITQDSVVLIFPGAAGPDSSTQLLKERIEISDKENGTQTFVTSENWGTNFTEKFSSKTFLQV